MFWRWDGGLAGDLEVFGHVSSVGSWSVLVRAVGSIDSHFEGRSVFGSFQSPTVRSLMVFSQRFLRPHLIIRFCFLQPVPAQQLIFSSASLPMLPAMLFHFCTIPSDLYLRESRRGIIVFFGFCFRVPAEDQWSNSECV